MKFETKESSPCVKALTITAEAEETKAPYQKVLREFMREAVVPGFRKGKVPQHVILQKFAKEIQQEAQQECFRAFYPKALEEEKIDAVALQDITNVLFTPETGFSCTALVEVRPVFDLPKYRKLAIKAGDTAVTDEQVAEQLEKYRKAFAKYEDAKADVAAQDGDFVEIDYAGALDVKAKTPLSEVVPDLKAVAGGTGFWTQIEEGRFVPEILEAVKGMKIGETKEDVKVKFPKDNAPEALKGKKCTYTVTLKALRTCTLPDDAAFAAAAKVASLDELRKQTRERMEKNAIEADLENRKNQAIDLLLKKADFDVPPSLVRNQMQQNIQEFAQRAQQMGLPADYVEQNREKIMGDAETNAIRQVRLSYILLDIAKEAGITVSEDELKANLKKIADGSNGNFTADDLYTRLEEKGQLGLYHEQLRAEKTLDFVLAEAK